MKTQTKLVLSLLIGLPLCLLLGNLGLHLLNAASDLAVYAGYGVLIVVCVILGFIVYQMMDVLITKFFG